MSVPCQTVRAMGMNHFERSHRKVDLFHRVPPLGSTCFVLNPCRSKLKGKLGLPRPKPHPSETPNPGAGFFLREARF